MVAGITADFGGTRMYMSNGEYPTNSPIYGCFLSGGTTVTTCMDGANRNGWTYGRAYDGIVDYTDATDGFMASPVTTSLWRYNSIWFQMVLDADYSGGSMDVAVCCTLH